MTKILIDKADVKQALEALNSVRPQNMTPFISSARTALRQALKQQPAVSDERTNDEPVVWQQELANILCRIHRDGWHYIAEHGWRKAVDDADVKLAIMNANTDTRPQPAVWVGLTDEDIEIAFDFTQEGGGFDDFARAIEANLREKNGGKA